MRLRLSFLRLFNLFPLNILLPKGLQRDSHFCGEVFLEEEFSPKRPLEDQALNGPPLPHASR